MKTTTTAHDSPRCTTHDAHNWCELRRGRTGQRTKLTTEPAQRCANLRKISVAAGTVRRVHRAGSTAAFSQDRFAEHALRRQPNRTWADSSTRRAPRLGRLCRNGWNAASHCFTPAVCAADGLPVRSELIYMPRLWSSFVPQVPQCPPRALQSLSVPCRGCCPLPCGCARRAEGQRSLVARFHRSLFF